MTKRILLAFAILAAIAGGIGYGLGIGTASPAQADDNQAGGCGTPKC